MAYRAPTALAVALLLALALPESPAVASQATTLRVMLNPSAAEPGALSDATRDRLEKAAGAPLGLLGTTRTGALDLAVAGPRVSASVAAAAQRLRGDRAVLWVDTSPADRLSKRVPLQTPSTAPDAHVPGRKFMVRLNDSAAADWNTLLPRLSAQLGAPLTVERSIGNVWVLSLPKSVPTAKLIEQAQTLEQDHAIRYADAVRRVMPMAAPNDPFYANQWSLNDPVSGINIEAAWALGTGSPDITIAVVDTGTLEHPDLVGRVLAGYDFITDPESARDDDARDPNPRDEGDWTDNGDCGGFPAQDSFWHGLFVEGLIAANTNNGIGIAGTNWASKILPVRALGKCGGTTEDVFEAMMWAAGAPIAGVPPNTHPAKVINMSLGGYGLCAGSLQEAVDEALAQGTIIVVSAGNASDDAENYAPGNCGGVINVGASSRSGDRTGYSNFGRRVDISAPGGDGFGTDTLIVSTFNDGTQRPAAPNYAYGAGTSFSAPLVSGTVSLMLSRNPNLTAGQVLSILQGASRDFPLGTSCSIGGLCGAGLLDAGTAVASTMPAASNLPDGAVAVVEFYDAALDHYVVTADPLEIESLNASAAWLRTGHVFYGWANPASAPSGVSPVNVCRFYADQEALINSYFFTADPQECSFLAGDGGAWALQTDAAFYIEVPDPSGACRSGTIPVYRFFNNRRDASQRFTIDLSVRRAMINRAWVPDGPGVNGAAFCSLI